MARSKGNPEPRWSAPRGTKSSLTSSEIATTEAATPHSSPSDPAWEARPTAPLHSTWKSCRNCAAYSPSVLYRARDAGQCRAAPPVFRGDFEELGAWPRVMGCHWCAAWRPRT